MSERFCQDYMLRGTPDDCFGAIYNALTAKGFEYTTYENDRLFQKGKGWVAAPTFVKISFNGNTARVETWMKYAILPGVYAGELGMTGIVGWAVKDTMKDAALTIDSIMGGPAARIGCDPFLRQKATPAGMPECGYAAQMPQYAAPAQHQYMPQQPAQPQYMPQQPAQTGFCRGCGAPLSPGHVFCAHCGTRND